jgi:hypothetical protein
MKLQLTAAVFAAATGVLFAGAAAAEPVMAKLQTSQGAARLVAGGAVFECVGDVCAARTPSSDTATVRGCKDLARLVGPITSFGPASKPLADDKLASCNASAKK